MDDVPRHELQAFAGTAKYETTFDAPNPRSAIRDPQFFLDLGDVRQSARVSVNGKDYGTLITPPFRVVVDNLKPTGNALEVEVTSVAANRIRDLDRRGVNWKTFQRHQHRGHQLQTLRRLELAADRLRPARPGHVDAGEGGIKIELTQRHEPRERISFR